MDSRRFEQTLVWHCAPALAGLKPACLMSLSAEEFPELPRLAGQYNAMMGEGGPRFLVLCRCRRGALLLVYREALLRRVLDHPGARAILRAAGYPAEASLPAMLRGLIRRLEESEGFPHRRGRHRLQTAGRLEGIPRRGGGQTAVHPVSTVPGPALDQAGAGLYPEPALRRGPGQDGLNLRTAYFDLLLHSERRNDI